MNNYIEILNIIKQFDEIPYYVPNGGNLGDALIAYNEFQFLYENNIKWHAITSLKYKKPYCLIHGGGGAFVPYWSYAQQLPKYLTNKNLKKCVILPSSFYDCKYFINCLDERFIIFCREKQSYEYCKSQNTSARFILCDDMAFLHGFEKLQIDDLVNSARKNNLFKNAVEKIDKYLERNKTPTASFIREDLESIDILDVDKQNFDISKIFYFNPKSEPSIANIAAALLIYAIQQYETIITNRLHVAIAAFILNKKIELYDNNYHKVKNVYELTIKNKPNNINIHF